MGIKYFCITVVSVPLRVDRPQSLFDSYLTAKLDWLPEGWERTPGLEADVSLHHRGYNLPRAGQEP